MLKVSASQMQELDRRATLRSVEQVESFLAECDFASFAGDDPNQRRARAVKALQRAADFGASSAQAACKVLVLAAIFGENFDLRSRAEGGVFADPSRIGTAELDAAFDEVSQSPQFEAALRKGVRAESAAEQQA